MKEYLHFNRLMINISQVSKMFNLYSSYWA